jgi:uncharacterized protein YabN with tetrapyrrole methylase and pyrophosphatase domain
LQVLFYSEMASEAKYFSIDDVLDRLSNKLVDRHPHVFGDVKADTSAEVLRNWEALKAEEKKKRLEARSETEKEREKDKADQSAAKDRAVDGSVLAGVSSRVPALMEALKLSSRAARVGFDWPEIEGLFEKLAEETAELREELKSASITQPAGQGVAGSGKLKISLVQTERLEEEVGDLFFVLVNIARFQWMEQQLRAAGGSPDRASMKELEALWQQAKAQEKSA